MKTAFVLPCLLFLALAVPASAEKTPVSVDCSVEPNDIIGMRLCTEVRDLLAASPRYREAAKKELHWGLRIITTADTKGSSSAQAVIVTYVSDDGLVYYVTGSVMLTGLDKISQQAKTIIAALDEEVTETQKYISQ